MTYKESLVVATITKLEEVNNACLVEKMPLEVYLDIVLRTSKPIKRYLDNHNAAELKAKELGSYSIKDIDDYLKTLKENK